MFDLGVRLRELASSAVTALAGDEVRPERFTRARVPVLRRRVADELPEIRRGWTDLAELVGRGGRKFFGMVDRRFGEYHLCTRQRADDPADRFGLEVGELAGGTYLRVRLRAEPPALYDEIAGTFDWLHTVEPADELRYDVEFYKRRNELELWMPVR